MDKSKKEENKKQIGDKPGLHTYASDMVKVLEYNEGGLARQIIEEEEKKETDRINYSPVSRRNKLFLFASIILVIASFFVLFFVYFKEQKEGRVFPSDFSNHVSPIFLDSSLFIDVSEKEKNDIASTILSNQKESKIKEDGVLGFYLTSSQKSMTFSDFIEKIEASFSSQGLQKVNPNFLFGVVSKEKKELFLLLSISSFQDIFDHMKAWEDRMFFDFYPFFGLELNEKTNFLLTKDFENTIVRNKNGRVLYDDKGEIVLMYIYTSDNTILITQSEVVATEIIDRLNSTKIRR